MEEKKIYGVIYCITNLINGKKYVGQTIKKVSYRFNQHAKAKKSLIGKAIRKYGRNCFHVEILEECYSYEELNAAEIKWIKDLNTKYPHGYNMTDGGEGVLNPDTSTREKMSKASMGNKNALGRKHTEDEKRRISETQKGRVFSKEHCEKISLAQKGKKASDETKKKMSLKRKGRKFTKEHRQKISEARKAYWASIKPEDRKLSEEHKARIAVHFSGSNHPAHKPENAKKISEGLKRHYDKKRVEKENLEAAATSKNFK